VTVIVCSLNFELDEDGPFLICADYHERATNTARLVAVRASHRGFNHLSSSDRHRESPDGHANTLRNPSKSVMIVVSVWPSPETTVAID
jgi:hypothetical protein